MTLNQLPIGRTFSWMGEFWRLEERRGKYAMCRRMRLVDGCVREGFDVSPLMQGIKVTLLN